MTRIVLISGSLRPQSTSELVARWCAARCREGGATAEVVPGTALQFPFYRSGVADGDPAVRAYLDALRAADGVVLISPTYHGTVSGLLKNALDYVNELTTPRAYLDGVPVGCVAIGAGAQGTASTLGTLRTIAHAVRAWPTPLGVTLHAWAEGTDTAEQILRQQRLTTMTGQVLLMATSLGLAQPAVPS
ncbi:NADPH-dependent FMN reductase [Mangrovihabitans endophyticus]|nr:NAD(P)H-dependent oxidoreductase [Mangrovihabitans endophyticus]